MARLNRSRRYSRVVAISRAAQSNVRPATLSRANRRNKIHCQFVKWGHAGAGKLEEHAMTHLHVIVGSEAISTGGWFWANSKVGKRQSNQAN